MVSIALEISWIKRAKYSSSGFRFSESLSNMLEVQGRDVFCGVRGGSEVVYIRVLKNGKKLANERNGGKGGGEQYKRCGSSPT